VTYRDNKTEIISRLLHAREDARRFLVACGDAIKSVDVPGKPYSRNRDFDAAKRATLDLSRKLAELGRPL
jgi:hypothetical protein